MKTSIAPTDSRMRQDLRLYEQGHFEEADTLKFQTEEDQRRTRKEREDGLIPPHQPMFFKQVEHPFVRGTEVLDTKEEAPLLWKLIEGPKGYWERRNRKDWTTIPDLFHSKKH